MSGYYLKLERHVHSFIQLETYVQYPSSILCKYFYSTLQALGSYNDNFIYSALGGKKMLLLRAWLLSGIVIEFAVSQEMSPVLEGCGARQALQVSSRQSSHPKHSRQEL